MKVRGARTVEELADRMSQMSSPDGRRHARAFHPRPSDVVIAPDGKSGTTFLQHVAHGVRTGGSMDLEEISCVVPWTVTAQTSASISPWSRPRRPGCSSPTMDQMTCRRAPGTSSPPDTPWALGDGRHKLPIATKIRRVIGKTDGDDVVIHLSELLKAARAVTDPRPQLHRSVPGTRRVAKDLCRSIVHSCPSSHSLLPSPIPLPTSRPLPTPRLVGPTRAMPAQPATA